MPTHIKIFIVVITIIDIIHIAHVLLRAWDILSDIKWNRGKNDHQHYHRIHCESNDQKK